MVKDATLDLLPPVLILRVLLQAAAIDGMADKSSFAVNPEKTTGSFSPGISGTDRSESSDGGACGVRGGVAIGDGSSVWVSCNLGDRG